MASIPDAKADIQSEETAVNAAVSEATLTRVGGGINFHNNRQHDIIDWKFNGRYQQGSAEVGLDGLYVFLFDGEIVGLSMGNIVAGTSGTTTVDIHWFNGSGSDQGTIFSVQPSISSAAPNNAYLWTNLVDATSNSGAGLTIPTFSKTEFSKGDAVRLDLDASMASAENLVVNLYFRPR